MPMPNYPSPILAQRRADIAVHAFGLSFIVIGGSILLLRAEQPLWPLVIYVLCALASNLSSQAYHFAPWHTRRKVLRRIDHAAIYISITGTFTPLLVSAGTPRALWVLALCWGCAALGIWLKLVSREVKSRWSTASYLLLGVLSLTALPDVYAHSPASVWYIVMGSAAYVLGTVFYTRKTLPYRYPIWHAWVCIGAVFLYVAVWLAVM